MSTFNQRWAPSSALDYFNYSPDSGTGQVNYAGAFNMPGVDSAWQSGDGYTLNKSLNDRDSLRAEVGADGNVGDWTQHRVKSDGRMLAEGGLLTAAMFTGLGALGQGPMAGYFGAASPGAAGQGAAGAAPAATAPSGGLLSGIGGKAVDLIKSNPKLLAQVAGGIIGAASGGDDDPYTGPMPTITRGGFQPQVQAMSMPVQDVSSLTTMPKKGQKNSGLWRFLG